MFKISTSISIFTVLFVLFLDMLNTQQSIAQNPGPTNYCIINADSVPANANMGYPSNFWCYPSYLKSISPLYDYYLTTPIKRVVVIDASTYDIKMNRSSTGYGGQGQGPWEGCYVMTGARSEMTPGVTYQVSIDVELNYYGRNGTNYCIYNYTQNYVIRLWIDFNMDGHFDHLTEWINQPDKISSGWTEAIGSTTSSTWRYTSAANCQDRNHTYQFTVPSNQGTGTGRMRVMHSYYYPYATYNSNGWQDITRAGNACWNGYAYYYELYGGWYGYNYGEVEDYLIDFTPVNTIFPICQNKTLYLDGNGIATISAEDIDNGSYSGAGIKSLDINKSNFDCSDVGDNIVTLTVTDIYDNTATCDATVTVVDNIPPTISVSVNPSVLWPANNKMEEITATVTIGDNCDGVSYVLTSISSDENINNDVANAAFGTNDLLFDLRRKRDGNGSGRIYTITYTATDASGNTGTGTATVTVPHDNSKSVLTDGSEMNGIVNFNSYPNPFTNETTIEFTLPEQSEVTVKVYNLQGNLVNTLHEGLSNAGLKMLKFNTQNYPAGEYTVVLTVGSEQFIHKVMKVK